jgi:hypothetical protein
MWIIIQSIFGEPRSNWPAPNAGYPESMTDIEARRRNLELQLERATKSLDSYGDV